MSEVSAVSGGLGVDQSYAITADNKEENSPEVLSAQSSNEEQLNVQETMRRAIAPNLRDLEREIEIKDLLKTAVFPDVKLPLLKELFKLQLNTFVHAGLEIKPYIDECKRFSENNSIINFTGQHDVIKNELIGTYFQITQLMEQAKKYAKLRGYPCPLLQLYALERETGFSFLGTKLLVLESKTLVEILNEFLKVGVFNYDRFRSQRFYGEVFIPAHLAIFANLENSESPEICAQQVEAFVSIAFTRKMLTAFPVSPKTPDPLTESLKYIVKYSNLEKIEGYFYARHSRLSTQEQALKWVDLHCQGAEHLAASNPEKAKELISEAKVFTEGEIWSYPFSLSRRAWNDTHEKAIKRIQEAETNLIPPK